jgi:hypothetical protein
MTIPGSALAPANRKPKPGRGIDFRARLGGPVSTVNPKQALARSSDGAISGIVGTGRQLITATRQEVTEATHLGGTNEGVSAGCPDNGDSVP